MNKIAVFLGIFLLAASSWAADKTAKLEILQGKVQLMRSGQSAWLSFSKEQGIQDLSQGDRVRTSNKAKALITMDDGSRVELSPSSIFIVDFLDKDEFRFKLTFGKLKALVSKIKTRRFSVITPTAVCAVRGTEFGVEFNESSQNTNVAVFEGAVAVSDNQGSEVLLGAGQQVQVTPEGLNANKSGQSADASSEDKKKAAASVKREVGLGMSREDIEAAAALEIKTSVAQDGKTMIDAFGKRVRVEQYISRPASDRISWVVLNTRDASFNYSRLDVWANKAIPAAFNSNFLAGLYFKNGASAPEYYALKDQWYMSNLKDYWLYAKTGGNPVQFTANGATWWETIFDHKYLTMSDDSKTHLLEHYVPATGVKGSDISVANGAAAGTLFSCSAGAGSSCMDSASPAYGNGPDFFYSYYDNSSNGAAIGSNGGQLASITASVDGINTQYATTEGYYKNWSKYVAGRFHSDAAGNASGINLAGLPAHETIISKYGTVTSVNSDGTPNGFSQSATTTGKSLVMTENNFIIDDEGKAALFGVGIAKSKTDFFERFNFEFVTESPTFSSKIDLVAPLRIFNALDAASSRPN